MKMGECLGAASRALIGSRDGGEDQDNNNVLMRTVGWTDALAGATARDWHHSKGLVAWWLGQATMYFLLL